MISPLRLARIARKLKQRQCAEALGITCSHYCRVEQGISKASTPVARRIADFFPGLTRDQILFPEEYPARPDLPAPRRVTDKWLRDQARKRPTQKRAA